MKYIVELIHVEPSHNEIEITNEGRPSSVPVFIGEWWEVAMGVV